MIFDKTKIYKLEVNKRGTSFFFTGYILNEDSSWLEIFSTQDNKKLIINKTLIIFCMEQPIEGED